MKIKEPIDLRTYPGTIYFMSDLHYNHANVLRLSHRDQDFYDVYAMNSYIESELSTLKPEDIVFDLGDMTWKLQVREAQNLLGSIPTKNLYKIMGNHDAYNLYRGPQPALAKYFKVIADILEVTVIDKDGCTVPIYLQHAPCDDWYGMYRGSIHLFGHVHGHFDARAEESPMLRADIGFDSKLAKECGSFLVPFEKVIEHFKKKTGNLSFLDWARETLNPEEGEEKEEGN